MIPGMNSLAEERNRDLESGLIAELLSDFGRRFYFPKGIVSQSGEAKEKAHRLNATIGMATEGGQPLHLPMIMECIRGLEPKEIFSYAPTAGVPELRKLWKEEILRKNPTLKGKKTSLPLVVSGLTHGISIMADLFADPGDRVIVPDMFWGNYRLIFEERREARVVTFAFFDDRGGFNLSALQGALEGADKAILILNFPNNPTGYSPSKREAEQLVRVLADQARKGSRLLVLCDDAYFGLFYEQDTCKQSLFAQLADLHENLLAVKIDGATKEDLAWGFRLGFITFAAKGLEDPHYNALGRKLMGAVRSSVSNCNHLGQSLLIRALESDTFQDELKRSFDTMQIRYRKVRELVRDSKLRALPFNSGYFMTFILEGGGTEALRQTLLNDHGIGTISIQDQYLRVAYSSVDVDRLEELYNAIYEAVDRL